MKRHHSSRILSKVSCASGKIPECSMRSHYNPQGYVVFHKFPSVSMRIQRVRVSEGLSSFSGSVKFCQDLQGSSKVFWSFCGSSRSPKILNGFVRGSKVLDDPLWLSKVRSGAKRFAEAEVRLGSLRRNKRIQMFPRFVL